MKKPEKPVKVPASRNRTGYQMERRNRLNDILSEIGLQDFKPSDELLAKLRMTRIRFFQILNNSGKNELSVLEKERIEKWLSEILNKPLTEIELMAPDFTDSKHISDLK